jgi:hypothetical protein
MTASPPDTRPTSAWSAASSASVQLGLAVPEADLVEPLPFADEDRKGARADLGPERAGVACRDAVEFGPAIGDGAGQEVEPAGGGLGVRHRRDAGRQREALHQRHDIDAAFLKHRAGAEVDAVHLEFRDAVGDGAAVSGEEARPDAIGHGPEAQVDRGGLDLRRIDGRVGGDGPRGDQVAQAAVGKNAGHARASDMGRGSVMVGLAGFEPATFRPPDGRANQAAP